MDIIVQDGGNTLRGKLQHKIFSIVTDIGRLKIPTKKIEQMQFDMPVYKGKDVIYTDESRFTGDIVEDPIKIKLSDTRKVVAVSQKTILAILVG